MFKLVYFGGKDVIFMYLVVGLFLSLFDGFFFWSVLYLLLMVIIFGILWFCVGVCFEYGYFFFSMYDISIIIIIKEMEVVVVKIDIVLKVVKMKYI